MRENTKGTGNFSFPLLFLLLLLSNFNGFLSSLSYRGSFLMGSPLFLSHGFPPSLLYMDFLLPLLFISLQVSPLLLSSFIIFIRLLYSSFFFLPSIYLLSDLSPFPLFLFSFLLNSLPSLVSFSLHKGFSQNTDMMVASKGLESSIQYCILLDIHRSAKISG